MIQIKNGEFFKDEFLINLYYARSAIRVIVSQDLNLKLILVPLGKLLRVYANYF